MSRWNTEKNFASWLGLCPDNRVSGGKVLKRGTRQVVNRAAIHASSPPPGSYGASRLMRWHEEPTQERPALAVAALDRIVVAA